MLNFKKEYFKLEAGRTKYSTSFSDLMTSCEVYGKKQNPITSTAFTYLIPKDYYIYNAGNIDFTNYPDGIWNDYTDIKIVKSEPYFDLDFAFSSVGDITPENLNNMFNKIKDYFLETQKNIVEKQIFMDSGIPEQVGLPKLPAGCIWYQDIDGLVALPVNKLYDDFFKTIDFLRKEIRGLLDTDYFELKINLFNETVKLKEQLEEYKNSITESANKIWFTGFQVEADGCLWQYYDEEPLNAEIDENGDLILTIEGDE